MRTRPITSSPRRIVVAVLAAVTAGMCVFVVVTHHGSPTSSALPGADAQSGALSLTVKPTAGGDASQAPAPRSSVPTSANPSANPLSHSLPALVRTDDPGVYARAVAGVLFGVTESQISRADFLRFWSNELPTVVYSDGAAKGLTLRAQNADTVDNLVRWWIPSQSVWRSEAAEKVTSRFLVTSVSVPDYWVNAVSDGTLRDPGLHMERVMGVVTQTYGTDPSHRQSSSRSLVIDLGLLCGPTQPGGCRLLAPQQPDSAGA